jgi:hypothetical protein
MTPSETPAPAFWIASCLLLVSRAATADEVPAAGDARCERAAVSPAVSLAAVAPGVVAPAVVGAVPSSCTPVWVIDAAGARRLPEREPPSFVDAAGVRHVLVLPRLYRIATQIDGEAASSTSSADGFVAMECLVADAASAASSPAVMSFGPEPDCALPYRLDSAGIRRVRPECLAADSASADGPVLASPDSEATGSACNPPFYVDPAGIRRLLPECL